MKRISFVILHFNTTEDTIECVESIMNIESQENISIIIVDNGSKNEGYHTLRNRYKDQESIYILRSEENLGFAKGNNIGYEFAKKLNSDFIIMINNDTLVTQKDFIDNIIKIYDETKFGLLGPDIITVKDNVHQNPLRITPLNTSQIKQLLYFSLRSYIYSYFRNSTIAKYIHKKYGRKPSKKQIYNNQLDMNRLENVVLHGACLIFSDIYIKKFDTAFDPRTFLYGEEDILWLRCEQLKIKIIYDPNIYIFHKEDVSTNSLFDDDINKQRFILKHRIRSFLLLFKLEKAKKYNR